ncbi:hypothetical protein [Amycolatopsis balhimycina]|uniref:hypothetical protein n=1 Tax=Amycolatopsis TaxID=1813 RepID=UPI001469ACE7|nr:hypothetical protein [Amycolatopsis balhimycina]
MAGGFDGEQDRVAEVGGLGWFLPVQQVHGSGQGQQHLIGECRGGLALQVDVLDLRGEDMPERTGRRRQGDAAVGGDLDGLAGSTGGGHQ